MRGATFSSTDIIFPEPPTRMLVTFPVPKTVSEPSEMPVLTALALT